jgi:hypothetical protein
VSLLSRVFAPTATHDRAGFAANILSNMEGAPLSDLSESFGDHVPVKQPEASTAYRLLTGPTGLGTSAARFRHWSPEGPQPRATEQDPTCPAVPPDWAPQQRRSLPVGPPQARRSRSSSAQARYATTQPSARRSTNGWSSGLSRLGSTPDSSTDSVRTISGA